MKVCLGDIQTEKGHQVVEELRQKFGKDKVFFETCDVISEADVESKCYCNIL